MSPKILINLNKKWHLKVNMNITNSMKYVDRKLKFLHKIAVFDWFISKIRKMFFMSKVRKCITHETFSQKKAEHVSTILKWSFRIGGICRRFHWTSSFEFFLNHRLFIFLLPFNHQNKEPFNRSPKLESLAGASYLGGI